jgi:hypothetical protein
MVVTPRVGFFSALISPFEAGARKVHDKKWMIAGSFKKRKSDIPGTDQFVGRLTSGAQPSLACAQWGMIAL